MPADGDVQGDGGLRLVDAEFERVRAFLLGDELDDGRDDDPGEPVGTGAGGAELADAFNVADDGVVGAADHAAYRVLD